MHRCLIDPDQWTPTQVTLSDSESRHLFKVIRARAGQVVGVFDGCGRTADAEVTESPSVLTLVAGSETTHRRFAEVTLYLSALKTARWELALEKATELGVATIVPVLADNCVARLDEKTVAAKRVRWARIIEGAAKQCGNPWVPEVQAPVSVEALTADVQDWLAVGALAGPSHSLSSVVRTHLTSRPRESSHRLGLVIGPEGDFTAEELQHLISVGAIPVSLGPRVLRAETAAMFGLSVIAAELDDVYR